MIASRFRAIPFTASLIIVVFSWIATGAAQAAALPQMNVAQVVIFKEKRELHLLDKEGKILKTYLVALGPNPIGPKEKRGDGRTPEGKYIIDWRNPESRFHRSLHISYPNAKDKSQAQKMGVDPGGDIMIHGLPNGMENIGATHREVDWTAGCIAVTNEEIEEIWKAVADGTHAEIFP